MLDEDVAKLSASPTMETDSLSTKLKMIFDAIITDEMEPQGFSYFTKVKGDKALILVKIPTLKGLKKSERPKAVEWIEEYAATQPDLKDKELYIGVHGKYNMMLIKTPTDEENSRLALENPLYDFYGPKVEKEE